MNKAYALLSALLFFILIPTRGTSQDTLAAWNFPLNPDNSVADAGSASNLSRVIVTRGGTGTIDFSGAGITTNAATVAGWDNGSNLKYWMIGIETTGYSALSLSSVQRSGNTGPRDFKIQYTLDTNAAWTDLGSAITVLNNWTSGVVTAQALPVNCENQAMVYLRWIMTGNTSVTGGIVDAAGTSRIDNILITGSGGSSLYATCPYLMTFENLWVNGSGLRDLPSLNWLNTPSSGNNSWRRDDDEASWTSVTGAYLPAGADGSSHSARFHTWDAPSGSSGNLDLYLNCSNPGAKNLSFYYINPSGSDQISISLSTDGGASFTPLGVVGLSTAWTLKTLSLGTLTSPTCVIRFTGTSDYGMDDMGIDQVQVAPPVALDAGLTAIVAPASSLPSGNYPVKVNIKNFGTDVLTSATLQWSVNGVAQSPYNWSGSLAALAVVDSVQIGTFNFSGGLYSIRVNTALPNGSTDGDHSNDTLVKDVVVVQYAAIPFHENFDGAWISKMDSLDVPSLYWSNTPVTGNNSWRRDDEGSSANWAAATGGGYAPAGANTTAHSARFHTYYATAASQGIFELNINLNSPGGKSLSYYYINTDGTDQLQVFLSTDGGSTFTLLSTRMLSATWTKYVENLGSSTASNAIIRFVATSDFGNTDLGLDEVKVEIAGNDLEMVSVDAPVSGCSLGNNEEVTITLRNTGIGVEHHFPVSFSVNGSTVTETYTASLSPGNTGIYTFLQTADLSGNGSHTIEAWTALAGDSDHSNDTVQTTVVSVQPINTFPFAEGFESGNPFFILTDTLQSGARIAMGKGVANSHGLQLTGGQQGIWAAGTGETTTPTEAWDLYKEHQAKAVTCLVDATTLSAPELKLDLRQTNTAGTRYSWFRVLVNDSIQLSDTSGTADFNPLTYNSDLFKTRVFDLQAFAGSVFTLSLQSSCKYDSTFDGVGDNAFIDNILIRNRPNHDLLISTWNGPFGGICNLGTDSIRVSVKNPGVSSESNIPVKYSVNNGSTWVSDMIADTLHPGDSVNFTFQVPADFSAPAAYPCLVALGLPTDEDRSNDTIHYVVNSLPFISSFPYAQNFESAFTGWTSGADTGINVWLLGTPEKLQLSSAHSGSKAWTTLTEGNYPDNLNCYVLSPCFDFSSLTDPQLSVWLNIRTEDNWDGMILETSVSGGPWTHYATDTLFYNNQNDWGSLQSPKWSGNNTGWIQYKTALQGFAGLSDVKLRFRFVSDFSYNDEGIALDDLFISDPLAYDAALTALTAPGSGCSGSTPDPVTVRIENAGTLSLSDIPVAFSVDGGTWISDTVSGPLAPGAYTMFTFSEGADLTAAGDHVIAVATGLSADLNPTNDTLLATVSTFGTIVPPLPYTEDFESGNHSFDLSYAQNSYAELIPGEGTAGSVALHFTGGDAGSWPGGTGTSTTSAQAWDGYTDHQASAVTCNIDLAGVQSLFLSLDIRQTHSGGPKYSWFRVMKDGSTLLADTLGRTEFNPVTASNDSTYTIVYNLTSALSSTFTLSLQACNKYSSMFSPGGTGDNVYLDHFVLFDTSSGSSVEENKKVLPLVFPNPTNHEVFINFGRGTMEGQCLLYDLNGRLLMQQEFASSPVLRMDLNGLSKGLYFLTVNGEEQSWNFKIIKE